MTYLKDQVNQFLLNKAASEVLESDLNAMAFFTRWAARAFGLTLAAAESGAFSLQEFQQSLVVVIGREETAEKLIVTEQDYYSCWLEALTDLILQKTSITSHGLISAEQRVRERLMSKQNLHSHSYDRDHHDHDAAAHVHHPEPVYVEKGL